jgi:hypothetical protein
MKLKNIIRVQLVLAGLAAAMIFARPVQAQQEMDPTSFDVTPHQQLAPSQAVAKASAVAQTEVAATPKEETASSITSPDANSILALTMGLGTIALLGFAEMTLGKRRRGSRWLYDGEFSNSSLAN